jgi:hypothetical protein
MPGAIALAAVFFLTVIEMAFTPGKSVCSGGHGDLEAITRPAQSDDAVDQKATVTGRPLPTPRPPLSTVVDGSSPLRDKGPLFGRSNSFSRTLTRIGEESKELDRIELAQMRQEAKKVDSDDALDDSDATEEHTGLTPEIVHKRAVLQVMLLEMGILFHSVFIGMALSVSVGSDFIILLIAIVFHRKWTRTPSISIRSDMRVETFEGLALGARIASLKWPKNAVQPWVMAFTYGCTYVHLQHHPDNQLTF